VSEVTRTRVSGKGPDIPVLTVVSPNPGPVVVLTANLHGDECTGIGVIQRLSQLLPGVLGCGRVHLYPSLNPDGLIRMTRSLPGADRDPNRAFPGRASGDRVERHVWRIWKDILSRRPDLLVDLHTDSTEAIPYAITDRVIRGNRKSELTRHCLALARASGLTVLREYPEKLYERYKLDRSLPGAMVNSLGIPSITLEVGPRGVIQQAAVEAALAAAGGVLTEIGILDAPAPIHPSRIDGGPWRRSSGPAFAVEGVFHPALSAGARFNTGALLGEVVSLDGSLRQQLTTPAAGFVVALPDRSWVRPGQTSSTLGILDH
jgi:predicted deacylase